MTPLLSRVSNDPAGRQASSKGHPRSLLLGIGGQHHGRSAHRRATGLSLPHLDVSDAVVLDERVGTLAHRDLALIPSTEDDGITLNRTKSGISPFVPIVKTPTYSANSGMLSGYSVEIEDPDEDAGFRCVGNVPPAT